MQKPHEMWGTGEGGGRKPSGSLVPYQAIPTKTAHSGYGGPMLEEVLDTSNMRRAWLQVKRNKGAAGVDRMSIKDAEPYLHEHWQRIKSEILAGRYRPSPVRRVDIPKQGGGLRMLGVPTVLDRLLQQAVAQVLTPMFDPTFSESSYGFRPGRSAHQAITAAKAYIADGRRWVVNLDLSKFFDRVNHDILMERLSRRIHDKGLLKLIRSWLTAGMMADGVVNDRTEGTPQGGPLSPLLANILLDELDKKLEAAGHKFCRYADDCNVYVRSKRAGERVMKWMRGFLEGKLKLKVNETKSAVDRPWKSKFLGISFTRDKKPKVRVASQSLKRFKERIRRITSRRRGISLERMVAELNRYLIGWRGYFRIAETPSVMQRQDGWIRRRLRCFIMKQWKRARTIYRELTKRGAPEARNMAGSGKGWWRLSKTKASHMALGVDYFRSLGLASLAEADGPAA